MESTKIQSQIIAKKKTLVDTTAELEGLREERARIALDQPESKRLKGIGIEIADTYSIVHNLPAEIRLLNTRFETALAKEKQAAKDALLSQQKVFAGQLETLSVKFVEALEVAYDFNLQLITATDKYCALQKQTGQDVIIKPTCRGSMQMMKILFETNEAELAGVQQPRIQGQPPYLYI